MKTSAEVIAEVSETLRGRWERIAGRTVPDTDNLPLRNLGVELEATVLYADMTDSTALVDKYKDTFAAEIYKAFLMASCHAIRNQGGEITAFDGDRVMAVFLGSTKNTDAAKAALNIRWTVDKINGELRTAYPSTAFILKHCVGIDTSKLLVANTGIRNNKDLVWVGRAANYAAKLCAHKGLMYSSIITKDVFEKLHDSSKFGGTPRQMMWTKDIWAEKGMVVYGSNWYWDF